MPRSAIQISPRLAFGNALFLLVVVHGKEGLRTANHRPIVFDPCQQFAKVSARQLLDGGFDFGDGAHGNEGDAEGGKWQVSARTSQSTNSRVRFTLGLPRGADGQTGPPGPQGNHALVFEAPAS